MTKEIKEKYEQLIEVINITVPYKAQRKAIIELLDEIVEPYEDALSVYKKHITVMKNVRGCIMFLKGGDHSVNILEEEYNKAKKG